MQKSKFLGIVFIPLLLVEAVFVPTAHGLDARKLYQLCSRFPLNSQCQGYETPIALDDRAGKIGDCIFKNNEVESRGLCKITVNGTGITIYQETGKELEIINDKKSTRTVQITPTSVGRIQYREDEKGNTGAKIVNTILFGVAGLLLTPNKKVSEIEFDYTSTTPQDTSQEKSVNSLRVFIERETGREMRSQLEKITGRQAETPQTKL
ncbi:MAG: hypothetical protein ACKO9I_23985 [Sphaerospermopsis kisseleviana]|jgi:hypothetical protein|uniref:Uncharacterized protein n=3 Tax=Sphaerospermopsis TaxID=752201 RepID=A0A479ZS94_9CYAN|nr:MULTISPECIES: hypothetical protein [Sphaerospermopsis]BAZ83179.1 hypothetical protein NIES73_44660 [Sphaerospermopsis kisseleviana NIES-73]MBC5793881.1 hypothetical protein [Sphaerospermopsis sp. LEGE 00249]MBE9237156.1 hypothetical protein [Sphaerospermopsis aphanizomenoides LEGE 00250]MDB9442496.1 hypothetical protein [Sphaerospermopsis kisseleviana CS-549]GCL35375.1 hypothetical protein SR1949_04690 [Sphaerospermopsis reniformis]